MDLRVYGFIALHSGHAVVISHLVAARGGRSRVHAKPLIRISAEVPHAGSGSKSPGLREALNINHFPHYFLKISMEFENKLAN